MDLLAAFTHAADGVFAVDPSMRVVFWNDHAARIFGVDAEAAMGQRCDTIVHGRESSGAVLCADGCRVMKCSRRGQPTEHYDLVRTNGEGAPQWLDVSIVVLKGRRRADTLTVHLVRDVTARRSVEQRSSAVLAGLPAAGVRTDRPAITRREAEVLRLLAVGASNKDIAATLGISSTTTRNHIEHLLAKLGVHSKLEAVVYAAEHGLV